MIKDKTKQTCLNKYGVEYISQLDEIKEKKKKTNLEKYGVEYYFQTEDKKIKEKETNLKKYGVEYASQSEIVKNKIRETTLKKYGVEYVFQCDKVKEKIVQTRIKRYGVVYPSTSKSEKELLAYISEIYGGVIVANDYVALDGREIDIFLPELSIGFEYNGDYWHMNPNKYSEDAYNSVTHLTAKETWDKDNAKIELAKAKGIKIVVIWESEWKRCKAAVCENIKKIINI